MKKPYRNALRSRAMIREAFISLLTEKPIDKITVVDIVQRSNLSRNTFYAHYQDVYAVLEEYQQEALEALSAALGEAMTEGQLSAPLPFLLKTATFVEAHKDSYRVLLRASPTTDFIAKLRQLHISIIQEAIESTPVRDRQGLLLLVDVISAGFLELLLQSLQQESAFSPADAAEEIDRIYRAALPLYL